MKTLLCKHIVNKLMSSDDLSLGREPTPIRCENTTGTGPPYPTTPYIAFSVGYDLQTSHRMEAATTDGCQCDANGEEDATCKDETTCSCCCGPAAAYDEGGKLIDVDAPPPMIVECGTHCGCSLRCRNRVVGRGVQVPLTVFRTLDGRGWGVRSDANLVRGTFVCTYAGEIISTTEASARRRKRSLASRAEEDVEAEDDAEADSRPGKRHRKQHTERSMNFILSVLEHLPLGKGILKTTVDPTHRGNVGRYINHACSPNLEIVLVRVGSLVPSVAFFCKRNVTAGEELTFHYGGERTRPSSAQGHASQERRRPCRCGAASCEGWLPFDPDADGDEK
jgi:[histone H3]-lysine36 N-dimethyltransferase SETMAR